MNQESWKKRYPRELQKYDIQRLQRYEIAKAQWIAEHLDATPRQYQDAMNVICKRYGV